MNRPKISIFIAASLDGYIAKENDQLDWLEKFNCFGEDYGFHSFFASIDTLIVGRKTFEPAARAPHWPYPGKKVIVLSRTLESVGPHAEVYNGNIMDLILKLQAKGSKHVWIDGGITIAHFLKEKYVDQITVTIVPVLLGSGIPLFLRTGTEQECELLATKTYHSGMIQLTYQVR